MIHAAQARQLTPDECASRLRSDLVGGLRERDVEERRALYGNNELKGAEPDPLYKRYLAQFKDPLIGLLVGSALISLLMRQYDDAVSITIAVVIVVTVGFVQEHRSEQVLEKLTKLIPPKARLIRNHVERDVYASELVVGDVVILVAGDRVPADVRLSGCNDLLLEESSMTGESKPQRKRDDIDVSSEQTQSYPNMAYMGCLVLSGNGRGLVTAVGEHSQFGEMVQLLANEEPPTKRQN